MGYYRAGFDVVGVDIKPMPRYPFEFHQGDALEYCREHGAEFDAIHASPPCQAYVDHNKTIESKHPKLIEPTRYILHSIDRPFVIENVVGAPFLIASLMLCGTMFGLRVIRHRYFELSFPAPLTMSCYHWGQCQTGEFIGVYSFGAHGKKNADGYRGKPLPAQVTKKQAMDIDWMTDKELNEAIPPAYTEFIGAHLMRYLSS